MYKKSKVAFLLLILIVTSIFTFNIFAQDTKYLSEVRVEGYNSEGKIVWEGDAFVEGNEITVELSMPKNVVEVKVKPVASADCKITSISYNGQAYSKEDKIKVNDLESQIKIKATLSTTNSIEKEYSLKLKKRDISTDATIKNFSYNIKKGENVVGSENVDVKEGQEIVINIPNSISTIYLTTSISDEKIKNKYINVKIYDSSNKLYDQVNGISEVKYNFGQEKEVKFLVKTTAEDGTTVKEYNIKVVKESVSNDTSLSDALTVNTIGKDSEGYDKTLYTVDVDTRDKKDVIEVFIPDEELKKAIKFDIFVTTKNPTAKIEIVQNNKNIESYDISSYYISVQDPAYITVTAEDGTKKQYTLKIVSSLFAPKPSDEANAPSAAPSGKVEAKDDGAIAVYVVLAVVLIVIIAAVVILIIKKKKQYSHMDLKDFKK